MGLIDRMLSRPSRAEMAESITNLQAKVHGLAARERMLRETTSGTSMSFGKFTKDSNTALQGAAKFSVFDKMETDPHIKGALIDKALPLLTAEWEIEPASEWQRHRLINHTNSDQALA